MRYKKTREVNIFSASVVDLFASGLGVFLIVAIIALVNQKKENSKGGDAQKQSAQSAKIIAELEAKVDQLAQKIKLKQEENIILRTQGAEGKDKAIADKVKFEASLDKRLMEDQLEGVIEEQKEKIKKLKDQFNSAKTKVTELTNNLSSLKEMYQSIQASGGSSSSKTLDVSKFKVGSKIQLNNVQFYAGTEKTIEPYATDEINNLGKVLLENPNLKVEVSGHIFLSKSELEKGDVYDSSNLSDKRAKAVCDKLVLLGVKPNRLKCIGYGGKRYLYLTDDEYSREAQLNRRVEVEILEK